MRKLRYIPVDETDPRYKLFAERLALAREGYAEMAKEDALELKAWEPLDYEIEMRLQAEEAAEDEALPS